MLIACGSMCDLLISRATITPQFLILFYAAQWFKCQAQDPKTKKEQLFLSEEQNKNINFISTLCKKINRTQKDSQGIPR